jgi:hypothetical protein
MAIVVTQTGVATTAINLISRALRAIAVLGSGETPNNADAQDSFTALNDMLDSWSTVRLYCYQVVESSLAATLSDGSYTVGAGGDFNTTRPTQITSVRYTVGDIDYWLDTLNRDEFAAIPIKTEGGIPAFYSYEPSFPLGVLTLWPIPATTGTIVIQSPQQLTQFTTLTTQITFPPGYREAIHLGLCEALSNEFRVPLTPQLMNSMTNAKRRIRRLNVTVPVLSLPTAVTGNGYVTVNSQ